RTYAPDWGRFLQRDPKGVRSGINLYAALGNDPVLYVDPFGTKPEKSLWDQIVDKWNALKRAPQDIANAANDWYQGGLRLYQAAKNTIDLGSELGARFGQGLYNRGKRYFDLLGGSASLSEGVREETREPPREGLTYEDLRLLPGSLLEQLRGWDLGVGLV